jgi:L-ascorbate metabolism protein UlaG (beta-lactamase superfamily)
MIVSSSLKVLGAKPTGNRLKRILSSVNFKDGSFRNLSDTPSGVDGITAPNFLANFAKSRKVVSPPQPLPTLKSDFKGALYSNKPTIFWFGHSSYLICFRGKTILVDPIFSSHASPVPILIKAFRGTDIFKVKDLPNIDLLVITHDHYDHLDLKTCLALKSKVKQVCTSLGIGAHLEHWGYGAEQIVELDWWESTDVLQGQKITATPARHFSGRSFSKSFTLWSSFVLKLDEYQIFLGGDSGYDSHFKKIGETFGGFDLAILECGQYGEGWPLIHTFPEQSVLAARDLGARQMLPVHWAKFPLAFHSWDDPIRRVLEESKKFDIPVSTPKIGQEFVLGKQAVMDQWWNEL